MVVKFIVRIQNRVTVQSVITKKVLSADLAGFLY